MGKILNRMLTALYLGVSTLLFPAGLASLEKIIFNETFPVKMKWDYGDDCEEKVKIRASLDEQTDTLHLGIYTQDYNKKDWTVDESEGGPLFKGHTTINHTYSRVFILRPSRVKIEDIKQSFFSVRDYKWSSNSQPYDRDERTQLLVELADSRVDKTLAEVSLLKKMFDKFIKHSLKEEEDFYNEIFDKINPDYARTKILPYIPWSLWPVETAREYEIQFDIGNMQDEIPMYVWMRVDLGDSTLANAGSFPTRYGKLENILIKFILNKNNIKREDLYEYFLHRDELKAIDQKRDTASAITTVSAMNLEERAIYENDNVIRLGTAEYIIPERGGKEEKDLSWGIIQFKTPEDRADFMSRKRESLKYPLFVKSCVLAYIEKPTMEEVMSPLGDFSEEQYAIYGDLILDYVKRTGMEAQLDEDFERSRKLLEQIQNYREESD
jgi:hypothetical protein